MPIHDLPTQTCSKSTGQNIAGSFFESRSSTSVTRDGDVDLHGHIECLKEKVEVSNYR